MTSRPTLTGAWPSPLLLLALAVVLLAGCQTGAAPSDSKVTEATLMSVQELNEMLQGEEDFSLINVHIPFEGEIPGTDMHIPYNDIETHADRLPQEKDAKIVLYCRSDGMSTAAGKTLTNMGFTNLYNLEGGFVAWKAAGYELLTEPGR